MAISKITIALFAHTLSLTLIVVAVFLFSVSVASAQSFTTLVDSPLSDGNNIGEFLNVVYQMAIAAAALLAVVKIIIGGVKYMLTDIVTSKEDAKKEIRTALLGLVIIAGAVLILQVINPSLTKFDLKFAKPEISLSLPGSSSEQTAELYADWEPDECVGKGDPSVSGRYETYTIDVSDCDATITTQTLDDFTKNVCQGSSVIPNADNTKYSCKDDLVAEIKSIDELPAAEIDDGKINFDPDLKLLEEYMTWDGTTVTYDAEGHCNSAIESLGRTLVQCMESVKDRFINDDDADSAGLEATYCQENNGIARGTFSCELPTESFSYNDFEPPANVSSEIEAFRQWCQSKGSGYQVPDQEGPATDTDTLSCVKYRT